MKNYGAHVQYSVFECELKEAAYKKMREPLKQLVSPKHDSVAFLLFGRGRGEKDRDDWGRAGRAGERVLCRRVMQ